MFRMTGAGNVLISSRDGPIQASGFGTSGGRRFMTLGCPI
jgi:hypothetical protein